MPDGVRGERAGIDLAQALWARILATADDEGRLGLSEMTTWDLFPFEASDLRMKTLDAPLSDDPPRAGEDPASCRTCGAGIDGALWWNEDWKLVAGPDVEAVPVVVLEPRTHHDLTDLPDRLAAELGLLIVRLARVVESLSGVGRAHVSKWGDGGAHLHVFCFGRPRGFLQLRGSFLPMWSDSLPPMPDEEWRDLCGTIAYRLAAAHGGQVSEEGTS